jgi:hypothetical protein
VLFDYDSDTIKIRHRGTCKNQHLHLLVKHDRGVFSAAVANTDCENMSTETKGANPQHDRGTCSFAYDRDESVFAAARSGSDCRDLGVEKNQMDTVREGNIISSFFTTIYDFISQLSSQLLQAHV